MLAAVPLGAVVLIAAVGLSAKAKRSAQSVEAMAAASAFSMTGPPCPPATRDDLAPAHLQPARAMTFNGVRFARTRGYAECAWVETNERKGDKGYPVCHFAGPGGLLIKAGRDEAGFLPGVGEPATVSVIDGVVRCVISGQTIAQMLNANRHSEP